MFLEWSGWLVGVIGLVLAAASMHDAAVERKRNERLTRTLTYASKPTVLGQPLSENQTELRSLLIRAAAGEQLFEQVIKSAAKSGGDRAQMQQLAVQLRDSGLLRFSDPLNPSTQLTLVK